MNILIFGGSFDPIHNGHLEILSKTCDQLKIDKTIIVPAKNVAYKNIDCYASHRFNMIKLATDNLSNVEISDFEINKLDSEHSYTVDTIKHYKNLYPNDKLYLLIGSDQLVKFNSWKNYKEILELCNLLFYKRENISIKQYINKYDAKLINGELLTISSTAVKNALLENIGIDPGVYKYIIENGLYYNIWLLKYISQKRYEHVLRVADLAKQIALKFEPSLVKDAWLAGIYHDLAKEFKYTNYIDIAKKINVDKFHPKIWHGPIAAWFLKSKGFSNQLVLNAISRHTLAEILPGIISLLDKIIYCCDKLEPHRTNEDVSNIEYYRKLLNTNIEQCYDELVLYFKNIY